MRVTLGLGVLLFATLVAEQIRGGGSLTVAERSRSGRFRLDALLCTLLAVISPFEFRSLIRSPSFGPEYAQFFWFSHHRPFSTLVSQYLGFRYGWYRPTQFFLPFWIGDHFLSWHKLAAWRYCELATVLAICFLIYALILQLLPGRRMAAFLAALYFTCVPTIYSPLHELFAFDFLHVVFTLICVIAFIAGYRVTGVKQVAFTFGSWAAFVIALTCKEITVVIPLFLVFASLILLTYEPADIARRRRFIREATRLAPFWALLPFYWFIHVRWIPKEQTSTQVYRLSANWPVIFENIGKYPLWFARIYGLTPDRMQAAAGYINLRNVAVGSVLLTLLVVIWIRLWHRDMRHREVALLACAWIGVFLIVPVFSGGLFWHGNLALCGYCMLFGVAMDYGMQSLSWRFARGLMVVAFIVGAIALDRADTAEGLTSGYFRMPYQINATVLTQPPVPLGKMPRNALVYVEDRLGLSEWALGVGKLFNLVYDDTELTQVLVPRMDRIDSKTLERWLGRRNAFFFRYDDQFHWHDATEEFRRFAGANLRTIAPPSISYTGPAKVDAGVGFNVQPDGNSAVGLTGENFRPESFMLINGVRTSIGFATSESIAAEVPPRLFSSPGVITVQVQNPDGQVSNVIKLRVMKSPRSPKVAPLSARLTR